MCYSIYILHSPMASDMSIAKRTKQNDPLPTILVAEDDPATSKLVVHTLRKKGYEIIAVGDGEEALAQIHSAAAPQIIILDWMMPKLDGVQVCTQIRNNPALANLYVIFLTARSDRSDVVTAFESGADDFLPKPFDRQELLARVKVGMRIIQLQRSLNKRVNELERALSQVKRLQGLIPICSFCKKVRNDGNYWEQVEAYICEHTEAQFSHAICPECYEQHVKPDIENFVQTRQKTC